MNPMPCSAQYGRISRCIRRSNMCQPYCTTSTRPICQAGLDLLGLEVGEPDEADLAVADQVVERAHGLLERRVPVGPVDHVHVDVVGAEALEALVDRRRDPLGGSLSRKLGLSR